MVPAIHIAVDAATTTRLETGGQDGRLPADLELRESRCACINSVTIELDLRF